jgi:hypothetical protein
MIANRKDTGFMVIVSPFLRVIVGIFSLLIGMIRQKHKKKGGNGFPYGRGRQKR